MTFDIKKGGDNMTIDEAIKKYKQIINKDVFCPSHHSRSSCDDCIELSQIVQWLEELKTLRFNNGMIQMSERLQYVETGYYKGINDFEENLKEAINHIAFNSNDVDIFIDIIEYTAEYLRRNN